MNSGNFVVIATPKLDRESDFLQLRERYASAILQPDPHIRITNPWIPADLGEVMAVIEFISQTRKKLHPLAITAENWQEAGEFIIAPIVNGASELLLIRQTILGSEPAPLLKTTPEPAFSLILLRVPDDHKRALAVTEANRIGKTLGVIDALTLIRTFPDGSWQRLARFPFGIGRVDFYERLLS
ncbi:MAG: hypothetical protein N2248_06010 [candidate division WOR-3 bacterium]|uniref:2'-5' RNA ligase family protein n=1 Tax=candidate division WOR-3 bacterium TaxID=2052148 RepID=A0A7C3ELK0_UNCW3|nr:hypothetical protein [candidate division WOR-3 bacterium]